MVINSVLSSIKYANNVPLGSSLTFVGGFDPDWTINESSASELSNNIESKDEFHFRWLNTKAFDAEFLIR